MWPTIANHIQRHIRQPLQGEHCRSQRFYRHSVFSWLLTTPCRIHPICLSSPVESMSAPFRRSIQTNNKIHETIYSCLISLVSLHHYLMRLHWVMVELWGTAPQSKMTISQRIQNHHRFRPTYYSVLDWKLQVFRL